MSSSDSATPGGRARRPLQRRPADPVERTRWVFLLLALGALVLTAPGAVMDTGTVSRLLLATASLALAVSWIRRYRSGRATGLADAVDVVAATALALACPMPAVAFGVLLPAVWSRAMYGRTVRGVGYVVGLGAGVLAAAIVWGVLPDHTPGGAELEAVLGALPVLGLSFAGARHLGGQMLERERTRGRDSVLGAMGTGLLGLTDPRAIRDLGWWGVEEICRLTPGLRALAVAVDEETGTLRVVERAGEYPCAFETLPLDVLPADDERHEVARAAEPLLARATGVAGQWLCMPLPAFPEHTKHFPGSFMLLAAPDGVSAEAVTALQSLHNQVALALRSSQAHRDLAVQALTDALTGLPNRAAFTVALEEAVAGTGAGRWLLFLDLDDFKVVNDGIGHAGGDELLRHAAARMLGALREDDLCARLGGDEFAVLLSDATQEEARRVGERLVELLSAPITLDGRLARVGASVGLAWIEPGVAGAEVVRQADVAMYAAKAAGKNRVQEFSPVLLDVSATAALEAELWEAVERSRFVVHYQPIVAATDGRCVAVEALVRWDHPVRGLLPPAEFLEVAEHTGVVVALGEQVLRRACTDVAGWSEDGRPVAVHVNASPSQLAHPGFLAVVRSCLADSGLAPDRLVVEITESTVLDAPAVHATLDALAGLGVAIAVDDFGTGYSALTTLRTLPVDIVKIDKSFVAGAATVVADQAVLQAIAQMAQRLGLQTVAEGVEYPEQQEFVQRAGITQVQGHLHLPPVPAEELAAWLAGHRVARPLSGSPA
ncbi:putative bifunctional diguanylate cyclase/phosphodiesterase [Trujillonella endophytica]|uniref:Diguanylate cyclase (GGDEF) domain-containing protein n=1 Tax=Trujillonella endophytica TaxID=673521 RepID=A0A1H8UIR8_9ACTN|nr:EAL domain-containing protein [Trujillella endophytica]SEP02764.1 diguanylate cyclase (GGDEF) domain-containing protein [Trujillella endophytica]